jgi:hypothetical protein
MSIGASSPKESLVLAGVFMGFCLKMLANARVSTLERMAIARSIAPLEECQRGILCASRLAQIHPSIDSADTHRWFKHAGYRVFN